MLAYPEGLEVYILVQVFIYTNTLCMQAVKPQAGCLTMQFEPKSHVLAD